MTKQEQIDGIAKYVCNACEFGIYKACSERQTDVKSCSLALNTAKHIYNAGYRKVPNGAVVLTPEERDDEMKATNEILAERDDLIAKVGILGRENYDLKAEIKRLKKENACLLKACEEKFTFDTTENKKYSVFNTVRKEFAEKLKAKSEMFLVAKGGGVYGEKPYVSVEKIDELLKEYEE